MWVIYNETTGELIGEGRLIDQPDPTGISEKEVADSYCGQVVWDINTRNYEFVDQIPVSSAIPIVELLTRFTLEERIHIKGLQDTNPIIADFFLLLDYYQNDLVQLDDPTFLQGMNYFVQIGAITQDRYNEILGA
jgi:hypothetical protein